MAFDPMAFDPMAFDPRSFDPISENQGKQYSTNTVYMRENGTARQITHSAQHSISCNGTVRQITHTAQHSISCHLCVESL